MGIWAHVFDFPGREANPANVVVRLDLETTICFLVCFVLVGKNIDNEEEVDTMRPLCVQMQVKVRAYWLRVGANSLDCYLIIMILFSEFKLSLTINSVSFCFVTKIDFVYINIYIYIKIPFALLNLVITQI